MKRKILFPIFTVALFGAMVVSYNNCGDSIKLSPIGQKTILPSSTAGAISGSACAAVTAPPTSKQKIVIVIDMSFSNVGYCSGPTCYTGPSDGGTDRNGDRMAKAINFVNSYASNPDVQFAVIGFADYFFVDSSSTSSDNTAICTAFVNAGTARNRLQSLLTDQQGVIAAPSATNNMGNTQYQHVLSDCVQPLIWNDVSSLSVDPIQARNTYYTVLFLTDGKPTNSMGAAATDVNSIVAPITDLMLSTKPIIGGFSFQTVYYGKSAEQAAAEQFLNPMSQAGGNAQDIVIGSMANLDFTSLLQSPIKLAYQMDTFTIVNLTSLMRDGVIVPDSDVDGLPDAEDPFPYDRRGATAGKVLDWLCDPTTSGSCANPPPGSGCGAAQIANVDQLGLNGCDKLMYGAGAGVADIDNDRIPDAIEMLKGTLFNSPDSSSFDGDGVNHLYKIKKGRQPYFDETGLNTLPFELDYTVTYSDHVPGCFGPSGANGPGATFTIRNLPLVATKASNQTYTSNDKLYKHDDGENLIQIYFYSTPVSTTLLPTEIRATYPIKVTSGSTLTVQPGDFKSAGKTP